MYKKILSSLISFEPHFIVTDGDVKLGSIIKSIPWLNKPIITPDLLHLLKNLGKEFFKQKSIFKKSKLNDEKNGLGNRRGFFFDRSFSRNGPIFFVKK